MNVSAYYSSAHPHKNFFMIVEKKLFSRKTIVPLGENVLFLYAIIALCRPWKEPSK